MPARQGRTNAFESKSYSYRELTVWQKACDLAKEVYRLVKRFSQDELHGLTSQMRRAAVSVPANIAEGAGRWGITEYRHFVSIALGSLHELRTLLELARRFGYVKPEEAARLEPLIVEVESMATSLHKRLGDSKRRGTSAHTTPGPCRRPA